MIDVFILGKLFLDEMGWFKAMLIDILSIKYKPEFKIPGSRNKSAN